MYRGVLLDDERRRAKLKQREDDLRESQRKRQIYERVQTIDRSSASWPTGSLIHILRYLYSVNDCYSYSSHLQWQCKRIYIFPDQWVFSTSPYIAVFGARTSTWVHIWIDPLLCHYLGRVGAFCPQLQIKVSPPNPWFILQPNTLRYLHIDLDDIPSATSWTKISNLKSIHDNLKASSYSSWAPIRDAWSPTCCFCPYDTKDIL